MTSNTIDLTLTDEIKNLEAILAEKKSILFLVRLAKMYSSDISKNISDITIDVDKQESTWMITYTHNTNNYKTSDYDINNTIKNDSDDYTNETEDLDIANAELDASKLNNTELDAPKPNNTELDASKPNNTKRGSAPIDKIKQHIRTTSKKNKTTIISFGCQKKYFIRGGIKFSIYRNSTGELRIINPNYDFELDLEEQKCLITEYSQNKNIPECLALSVFLYISYNKWDDASVVNHFSLV